MIDLGRCPSCPDYNVRCVPSDGPLSSRVLFIGEAPGRDEDYGGRAFVGMVGYELNGLYLSRAGLRRDDVRIANAVQCRATNNKKPSDKLIQICAGHHLQHELSLAQHEILVPMGAAACSLFSDVSLSKHHGYPLTRELYGNTYTVFPMYHPSAGLHSSNLMTPLIEDFRRLRFFLAGKLFVQTDQYAGREQYKEITGNQLPWVLEQSRNPVAIDTESTNNNTDLWSVQLCTKPGTGYLIRPSDRTACQLLSNYATANGYTMHYSTEDWEQLRRIGIVLPNHNLYDTIQGAFVDGSLAGGAGGGEEQSGGQWGSLGLKVLAWRLCGMEMKSFYEVVRGPSKQAAVRWLNDAMSLLDQYQIPKLLKTKVNWGPHPLASSLRRIAVHSLSSDDYDPWERWTETKTKSITHAKPEMFEGVNIILEELGPMPLMGIDKANPADALHYACRDADATFRLRVALESKALQDSLNEFIADADIATYEDL